MFKTPFFINGTMTETFILILIAMILCFILGFIAIWTVFRNIIANKYMKESKKLQLLINNLKRDYGELIEEPSSFIGEGMANIGVDGIIDALGIPSIFKPVAKGFIDQILKDPKKLSAILEKIGLNIKGESPNETVNLL
jgi:hypothetical protein